MSAVRHGITFFLGRRFNEKRKEQHGWYYLGVAERLAELKDLPPYQEYVRLCQMVFGKMGANES